MAICLLLCNIIVWIQLRRRFASFQNKAISLVLTLGISRALTVLYILAGIPKGPLPVLA